MVRIYWLEIRVGAVEVVLMVIQLLGQTIEIQKFKVGSNTMLISITRNKLDKLYLYMTSLEII